MKIELNKTIFTGPREVILLTGAAKKTIGMVAPVGTGRCEAHTGNGPAKYSAIAKVLDAILIDKCVKCLGAPDGIYAEITHNGEVFRVYSDGVLDVYEGNRLHGSMKFIPVVLYHLRDGSKNTELRGLFAKISKDFKSTGVATLDDIVKFCDCFYYTVAAPTPSLHIEEADLNMASIRAAIRSGELAPFAFSPSDFPAPPICSEIRSEAEPSPDVASPKEEQFDAIKAGSKLLQYKWNEHQLKKIPRIESLDDFVPCPEYYSILNKICLRLSKVGVRLDAGLQGVEAIGKDYINLMMVGKPGTGKTTLAYALGAATGMPTYSIALNKDSEGDVFQGMTKVVDGKLDFVATDFLDAYTNGGIIVLEEINLANPNVVMGTIGQAIEYPFVLMENGYKPVTRHPMCVIIGTMNVGTYGSIALNEALSSRFKTTYILDDPEQNAFIDILCKSGGTRKASMWVYNVYKKLIDFLNSPSVNAEEISMRLTMRGCIGALEAIEEGEPPKEAIRRTLIGKIAESDLELATTIWRDVISSIPDLKQ